MVYNIVISIPDPMFLMFQAVQEPHILDECELSKELKKVLLENIKQKLTQQAVKIRADIEVSEAQP
jgi:translation initiation factor 2 alpha subunit (eIF-2alpha)